LAIFISVEVLITQKLFFQIFIKHFLIRKWGSFLLKI